MGIVAALFSAVFSSAKDLFSKKLAFQIDGMTSTFASFAFALPFYIVVLAWLWLDGRETFEVSAAFLLLVFLRAVTDVLAEGMKMYAFSYADISVVACFFSLSPLLLLIASPFITGDELPLSAVFGTIIVVAGCVLVVYRPSERDWGGQKRGILLALAACFFFALNSCFDRLAVQQGTPIAGTPVFAGFAMTLLSGVFLLPLVLRRDRLAALAKYQEGLWARGFLEVAFMSAKLYALVYLSAPHVVNLQRVAIPLSIVGGRIFFREPDFPRRLSAGLVILTGVAVTFSWDWVVALVHLWWYPEASEG